MFERFGKAPSGDRLELLKKSPHYKNRRFVNLSPTPQIVVESCKLRLFSRLILTKVPGRKPSGILPSVKTDLLNISADSNVLVWFGHSSYFMQINGKRILVDPVLSGHASPIPGMIRSFRGTDIYSVSDLPRIDYLFITHDHYDHLDYKTIRLLKSKIRKIICGLGVGSHLEFWGYDKSEIIERDWYDTVELEDGFKVHVTPARHFSGRSSSRNNTLWVSFVLKTPSLKIFMGGDGGYDTHFAEIGDKHGPFDLVIIENGQYNLAWRYIHTLPEQVLQAAMDLNARRLFPVHSSRFALGRHPWDEPLVKIMELNKSYKIPLVTPMIGEMVNLNDEQQQFRQWWKSVE
ncbi:MAG: MBL fold metallo-hydrolase [Bacteroidales bacterium]|nr:MBL fold metallo-hydrolase [Lentimicrobiaceae bacterium]MDD5695441.1 MBL fold metallo-hydrolase [Bacteroidales bacterium]